MRVKSVNVKKTLRVLLVAGTLWMSSCAPTLLRKDYRTANELLHDTRTAAEKPYLKAHLKNGGVMIFSDSWTFDTTHHWLTGAGKIFDFNRRLVSSGALMTPLDSVALFETNNRLRNTETGRVASLSLLAGVDIILGIICITDPKTCYGSCPTFYQNEGDHFHYADAEGFSNAILPSMEYRDVDALNNGTISTDTFYLTMKNEALETHCVNRVKLLSVPRKAGERIFQSPDHRFFRCTGRHAPVSAKADEGNILPLLAGEDRVERFSASDPANIRSREEIILEYDSDHTKNGLLLSFRQTQMTTWLFYSAMGYMGNYSGDIFSMMETHPDWREKFDGAMRMLGGIEVYTEGENHTWIRAGEFNETGPIAFNRQLLPLPDGQHRKIKLVLNRGLWRIDQAALVDIADEVQPREVPVSAVWNSGVPDAEALRLLNGDEGHLISEPRSAWRLQFVLPGNGDQELFVDSKGYYLEWMRNHWREEQNLKKLKLMVLKPHQYLKKEAKNFKKDEPAMESSFWNSRLDTYQYSYGGK